jgi:hypothetical protein
MVWGVVLERLLGGSDPAPHLFLVGSLFLAISPLFVTIYDNNRLLFNDFSPRSLGVCFLSDTITLFKATASFVCGLPVQKA